MRGKKIVSLLLAVSLSFGMLCGEAQASKISETKEKGKKLQQEKKDAEAEKESLSRELDAVLSEMDEMEQKIEEKEEEIFEKEEELIQAKVDENDQYESMKIRIKYMYENGNSQFVEILFEAKDLSDFLNRTEYISSISEYDRDMLANFREIVKKVAQQEKELKEEQKQMEQMQDELIAKQADVEALLSEKNEQIAELKADINANKKKLKKLEAAAKAAAEAARKKAEAEAAARAAASSSGGGSAGAPVVSGSGLFTHPCPGYTRISSPFGYRTAPLAGASTNHKGVDLAAPSGTPIYAAAGGTVISASYSGNAGNLIVINHGNGLQTYYMHCSRMYVSAGQTVEKGQNIGAVGTTGNSTGPHLHFQVMSGGVPVNPLNYL